MLPLELTCEQIFGPVRQIMQHILCIHLLYLNTNFTCRILNILGQEQSCVAKFRKNTQSSSWIE